MAQEICPRVPAPAFPDQQYSKIVSNSPPQQPGDGLGRRNMGIRHYHNSSATTQPNKQKSSQSSVMRGEPPVCLAGVATTTSVDRRPAPVMDQLA